MDCVPEVPVGGREYRLRRPNAVSERPARAPIDAPGSPDGARTNRARDGDVRCVRSRPARVSQAGEEARGVSDRTSIFETPCAEEVEPRTAAFSADMANMCDDDSKGLGISIDQILQPWDSHPDRKGAAR